MLDHYMLTVIITGFLFLAFAGVLFTEMKAWKKLTICSLIILSSFLMYRSMNSFYGKPMVMVDSIKKTWVLSFYADIPKGNMYLWLRKPDQEVPVSYVVPYSPQVHKMLYKMREKNKGRPFMVEVKGGTRMFKPFNRGETPVIIPIPKALPRKR